MTVANSDNRFGPSDYIVNSAVSGGTGIAGGATHTTIGAAITQFNTDVSAGKPKGSIYIRAGDYTEDITLPINLNITGMPGSEGNAGVLITGKVTQTATGTSTISNCRFQTNGDVILDFGGSGTIQTSFKNCAFFLTDGDCLTVSNANASPNFHNCTFHQTANSLDFFNITATQFIRFLTCRFFFSASTLGTSTVASGSVIMNHCQIQAHLFTTSSTGTYSLDGCHFSQTGNNQIITLVGSGDSIIINSYIGSGSSPAISIGSGTSVTCANLAIKSTNNDPVTGAGTLFGSGIEFTNTGNGIDVTTWNVGSSRMHTLDIDHTATESDDHSLEIDCNAAGFGDVKAIDIAYVTGAITSVQDEECILLNIDETASSGGIVNGYEVLATAEGSAVINGYTTGININPVVHESGSFGDADVILNLAVDVTTDLDSGGGGNITLFVLDDDDLTIRHSTTWDEFEIILGTGASGGGVAPTFKYSTGGAGYSAFTPSDGTNGFRNTGAILWDSASLAGWATATSGSYEIIITRTRNSLSTKPIIDELQISSTTEYKWDKDGAVTVKSITLTTDLAVADGGTGASTLTGVLTGNGTMAVTAAAVTQYGVLVGGASNAVSSTAVGTATHVLTSNGAGVAPTFQAAAGGGSGAWTFVSSSTASASATINFTGLSTDFMYKVVISNLLPEDNYSLLYMRTSSDNGVSYDSGASDYSWVNHALSHETSVTTSTAGDNSGSFIRLGLVDLGNASNEESALSVFIYDPSISKYTNIYSYGLFVRQTGTTYMSDSSGKRKSAGAVDAIRFLFDGGNITTGTFKLYKLAAS